MLIVSGLYDIDTVDINVLWEINVLFISCFFYLTRNCKPVTLHICQDCFKKDMELNKDYIYIQYTHDC